MGTHNSQHVALPSNIENYSAYERNDLSMSGPGILTRKLLHSPQIKQVLPARLRSRQRMDLVLVGEDHIDLKDVTEDGSIMHITTRSGFAGKILTALIIEPNAVTGSEKDITSIEGALQDDSPTSQCSPISSSQSLALTLLTNELLFLQVRQSSPQGATFDVVTSIPLPRMNEVAQSPGHFLAGDPSSRALAVAAKEKLIQILELQPSSDVKNSNVAAINKGWILRCEGEILCMDFLYPSDTTPEQVLLSVVTRRNERTYVNIFQWSYGKNLQQAPAMPLTFPLSREHIQPIHFIPLNEPGMCLIVCQRAIALYDNLHAGNLQQRQYIPFGQPSPPGSRWIGWARPSSSVKHGYLYRDNLYIARTDGLLQRLILTPSLNLENTEAEHCMYPISSAFTAYEIVSNDEDAVIVGGDHCDGYQISIGENFSLYSGSTQYGFEARKPKLVFRNWAPCKHVLSFSDSIPKGGHDIYEKQFETNPFATTLEDGLYIANGAHPHGRVSELRYGLELMVDECINAEDMNGVITVDALSLNENKSVLVVFSRPWQTSLALLNNSNTLSEEYVLFQEPCITSQNLGTTPHEISSTLPTTTRQYETILLISRSQISFYYVADGITQIEGQKHAVQNVTAAAIDLRGQSIIMTSSNGQKSSLYSKRITYDRFGYRIEDNTSLIIIESEVTCIAIANLVPTLTSSFARPNEQDATYFAVGTSSGSTFIYSNVASEGLQQVFLHLRSPEDVDFPGPCECIAVCSATIRGPYDIASQPQSILLCTHRHGKMSAIMLRPPEADEFLRPGAQYVASLGELPLKLLLSHREPGIAFIWSNKTLLHIDFNSTHFERPEILKIHLCPSTEDHRNWPSKDTPFGSFQVVAPFPSTSGLYPMGTRMLLTTINSGWPQLLVGELLKLPKPVLRSVKLPGSPHLMTYLREFEALFVASVCPTITSSDSQQESGENVFIIQSEYMAANHDPDGSGCHLTLKPSFECKAEETVNDMLSWTCEIEQNQFVFIVLALSVHSQKAVGKGAIKFLKVKPGTSGGLALQLSEESIERLPVDCIRSYGSRSLVYCSGNELKIRTLSAQGRRFYKKSLHSLVSKGVRVSVHEEYVVVSTSEHSVQVFQIRSDVNGEVDSAQLIAIEDRARQCICHLALPNQNLMMTSDRNGMVTTLRGILGPKLSGDTNITAGSQINLQDSIITLFKAMIRPLWKQGQNPPGVISHSIFGMANDGSFYEFSVLDYPCWHLLHYIQALYLKHSGASRPLHQRLSQRRSPAQESFANAEKYHIDGEALKRLLDSPDAARQINEMLDTVEVVDNRVRSSEMHIDSASPTHRRNVLELMDKLFPATYDWEEYPSSRIPPEMRRLGLIQRHEVAPMLLAFLRDILESPF